MRVRVTPAGLELADGQMVPLVAASVHYWRLRREHWRPALAACVDLGFTLVDTYVPWAVHEVREGLFDFGARDEARDVRAFLRLAEELGLRAVVRPGPHINAELTGFGIPHRVLWSRACQARTPGGHKVLLPAPPLAFPVPSQVSAAFHEEAARWLQAVAQELAPLLAPEGPIVMVQVDNEGALYFRDGVFDQDYHPDAVALHRARLHERYASDEALQAAHGDPAVSLATVAPPAFVDDVTREPLAPLLDWAATQEAIMPAALKRFDDALRSGGLEGVPTTHNLPMGDDGSPLVAEAVAKVVDVLGIDYYHRAGEAQRRQIARRTTEYVARVEGGGGVPFAAELGAGFPPFYTALSEEDSLFTAAATLAYGLRGFNVYMAVERDRWIGAPIDPEGRQRPAAEPWRRFIQAFQELELSRLRLVPDVTLAIPRSHRRLARVTHGFGPIPLTAFSTAAGRTGVASLARAGGPDLTAVDDWIVALEDALEARGAIVGHLAADQLTTLRAPDVGSPGPRLGVAPVVVLVCGGFLEAPLTDWLRDGAPGVQRLVVGPHWPDGDDRLVPLPSPLALADADAEVPAGPPTELAARLFPEVCDVGLPHTRLIDDAGVTRVWGLLNAGSSATLARLPPGTGPARVAFLGRHPLPERPLQPLGDGRVAVDVPARTVALLSVG